MAFRPVSSQLLEMEKPPPPTQPACECCLFMSREIETRLQLAGRSQWVLRDFWITTGHRRQLTASNRRDALIVF